MSRVGRPPHGRASIDVDVPANRHRPGLQTSGALQSRALPCLCRGATPLARAISAQTRLGLGIQIFFAGTIKIKHQRSTNFWREILHLKCGFERIFVDLLYPCCRVYQPVHAELRRSCKILIPLDNEENPAYQEHDKVHTQSGREASFPLAERVPSCEGIAIWSMG